MAMDSTPSCLKSATASCTSSFADILQHAAIAVDALADTPAQVPRAERRWILQEEIVNCVALLAAHLQNVAESRRRQQANQRALLFNQRIGHQRRAVEDVLQVRRESSHSH